MDYQRTGLDDKSLSVVLSFLLVLWSSLTPCQGDFSYLSVFDDSSSVRRLSFSYVGDIIYGGRNAKRVSAQFWSQKTATKCGDLEWEGLAGPCRVSLAHRPDTTSTSLSPSRVPTARVVNETEEPDSLLARDDLGAFWLFKRHLRR